MKSYLILAAGMILLPILYGAGLWLCSSSFYEESNQKRKPFHSIPEFITIFLAEAAFVSIWQKQNNSGIPVMVFCLLFVMLASMTVFCMTDYWERIVPNKLLFLLIIVFPAILGLQGIQDMDALTRELPAVLLGFVFCAICFGLGYLLSHKNMGAGDVKLALVMGCYLTGEYAVGTILYGCIAASVFSLVQMARKKLTRKDTIPFVPFLYIGLIIRYLTG